MEWLTILAAIVGIIGVVYMIVFGQKSIPELLRGWFGNKKQLTEQSENQPNLLTDKVQESSIRDNLPPRPKLVGRSTEMKQLRRAIMSNFNVVSVDGIGGIGKSALILDFSHQCLNISKATTLDNSKGHLVFEAIVWITAQSMAIDVDHIINMVAKVLDYPHIRELMGEEKLFEIQRLLHQHRTLLIIDNFEKITDSRVIDFVSSIPNPSKCLITTRVQNIPNVYSLSLSGLIENDAFDLIRRESHILGLNAVEHTAKESFRDLCKATGSAPLALKWAIRQIKQRGQTLELVIQGLKSAEGDLFEYCFSELWNTLSLEGQHILVAMTFLASPTTRNTVKGISNISIDEFDLSFGQLVELWLVEGSADIAETSRTYTLHPLTRSFAASKVEDFDESPKMFEQKYVAYFLEYVRGHGDVNWQHYDQSGYDSLETEHDNIQVALQIALSNQEWEQVVEFYKLLMHFWAQRGYWQERVEWGENALKSAQRLGDTESSAWILVDGISWILIERGDFNSARILIQEGREIAQQANMLECMSVGYWHLGRLERKCGDLDLAQNYLRQSINEQTPKRVVARIHRELGKISYEQQDLKTASNELNSALRISEQINDQTGKIVVNLDLGELYRQGNRLEQAENHYQSAHNLAIQHQRLSDLAKAKLGLLKLALNRNDKELLPKLAQEALDIFDRLGMLEEKKEVERIVNMFGGN